MRIKGRAVMRERGITRAKGRSEERRWLIVNLKFEVRKKIRARRPEARR